MKVAITSFGGAAIASVEVAEGATVLDLKRALYENKHSSSHFVPARQRLTFEKDHEKLVLEDTELLSKYGISEGFKVLYKDLGPQIAFRTVYIIEYLGPIIFYPLFAMRLIPGVYPSSEKLTNTQQIALFLWMTHFIKRELETVFVHEFGTLTMPLRNIFKNSVYYWGFGLLVGFWINRPTNTDLPMLNTIIGFPWFSICMLLNLICHLQLKYLRRPGMNTLGMPQGFLFEFVTAPNYFLEIMMWFGFNILTGFTWAGVLFNIVGALQMVQWAKEKHQKYRKLFKDYPRKRKILIPFIF